MSYTKGDWTYFKSGANYLVSNEKGELLADVYAPEDSGLGTEEANAKLIASAPELLKYLNEAIESMQLETNNVPQNWIDAIKKATV